MKLCVVPQEGLRRWRELVIQAYARNASDEREEIENWWRELVARPPLPPDIQQAVELAKKYSGDDMPSHWNIIARALLKCCGEG